MVLTLSKQVLKPFKTVMKGRLLKLDKVVNLILHFHYFTLGNIFSRTPSKTHPLGRLSLLGGYASISLSNLLKRNKLSAT